MKRNIMGNGTTQCILCGDTFRLFGTSNFLCYGCKKVFITFLFNNNNNKEMENVYEKREKEKCIINHN